MNKSMFETKLIEALENDERVSLHDAVKNGCSVKAVALKHTNPSPTFYINDISEHYYKGEGMSVDACVEAVVKRLLDTPIPTFKMPSEDKLIEKATFRLLSNRADNKENMLFDVCGLPVVLNSHIEIDGGGGSCVIPQSMITNYLNNGHTVDEIKKMAFKNTEKDAVLSILDPFSLLIGITTGEIIKPVDPDVCEFSPMYVLTNKQGFFGASSILSSFITRLANNLKTDIYILPSSVHEIILVPDAGSVNTEELVMMVRTINETEVSPNDFLSDNILRYSRKTESYSMIE